MSGSPALTAFKTTVLDNQDAMSSTLTLFKDGIGNGSEAVAGSFCLVLAILGIQLLQDSSFYFSTSVVCDYFLASVCMSPFP